MSKKLSQNGCHGISTQVTPEQEKATKQYLSPQNYKQWKPIRGAED